MLEGALLGIGALIKRIQHSVGGGVPFLRRVPLHYFNISKVTTLVVSRFNSLVLLLLSDSRNTRGRGVGCFFRVAKTCQILAVIKKCIKRSATWIVLASWFHNHIKATLWTFSTYFDPSEISHCSSWYFYFIHCGNSSSELTNFNDLTKFKIIRLKSQGWGKDSL